MTLAGSTPKWTVKAISVAMDFRFSHFPQRPWARYKLDELVLSRLFRLSPEKDDGTMHVEAEFVFPFP